jgi:hypothetical protein
MSIDWETVLAAAFAAIGVLEYIKGFFKNAPSFVWRITQPVLCVLFAGISALLPAWVMVGILALAMSQVGYQVIIDTVKNKIGGRVAGGEK